MLYLTGTRCLGSRTLSLFPLGVTVRWASWKAGLEEWLIREVQVPNCSAWMLFKLIWHILELKTWPSISSTVFPEMEVFKVGKTHLKVFVRTYLVSSSDLIRKYSLALKVEVSLYVRPPDWLVLDSTKLLMILMLQIFKKPYKWVTLASVLYLCLLFAVF